MTSKRDAAWWRAYRAARRKPAERFPCGTYEAYRQHLYYGEERDEACRRAGSVRNHINYLVRKRKKRGRSDG